MHSVLLFSFLSFDYFLHAQSIIASSIRIDFVLYTHIDTSISIKAHINRIESLMIYNTHEIQFIPFSSELSQSSERRVPSALPLLYWLAFTENESGQRLLHTIIRWHKCTAAAATHEPAYVPLATYNADVRMCADSICFSCCVRVDDRRKIHLFECVNIRPFRFA